MSSITFDNGNFVFAGDARERIDAQLRRVGMGGDVNQHKMLADMIIPPIRLVADYQEWTRMFFEQRNIGPRDNVRIALEEPGVIALYTSPNGEVFFTRPGITTYVSPSYLMIDSGLEIGWDDMASAGWDVLGRKVLETGEEFARKRDVQGQSFLDAAAVAVSGHAATVAGGVMTMAAVDAILKAASAAGWDITQIAVNTATVMDMKSWVWGSEQHLWMQPTNDQLVLQKFYASNYGGASWYAFRSVPTNYVYFSGTPAQMGSKRYLQGGTRTASDVDIKKRVDLYTWDEKWGHYIENTYPLWRLEITA
jgi:hypothetical protein